MNEALFRYVSVCPNEALWAHSKATLYTTGLGGPTFHCLSVDLTAPSTTSLTIRLDWVSGDLEPLVLLTADAECTKAI